jgi:S-DNA-T family DNA segregation ATPase FtsK/SpoIIIE
MINFFKKIIFSTRFKSCIYLLISIFLFISLINYDITRSAGDLSIGFSFSKIFNICSQTVSQIIIQLFGIASFILAINFLFWSFMIWSRENISYSYFRYSLAFFSICMFAALLNYESKYFPNGYGGFIGAMTNKFFDYLNFAKIPFLLASGVLLFISSLGYSKDEHAKIIDIFIENIKELKNIIQWKKKNIPSYENVISTKSEKKRVVKNNTSTDFIIHKDDNISNFVLPSGDLLTNHDSSKSIKLSQSELEEISNDLIKVLKDFGIKGQIVDIHQGPVVTLYEFEPQAGVKSSRIIGLADDIARSLSAISARIAVIPGRNVLGIELPNKKREFFGIKSILYSPEYQNLSLTLPLILGKDLSGNPLVVDLAKMPHLLIAGTTGSGKSVAINTMIISLLYRFSPMSCKFIMIDPKMLELSVYDGIPHLLTPVVTEPHKAVIALKWAVKEMEDRYRNMSNIGVRNVAGYNEKIKEAKNSGKIIEKTVQTGFDSETGKPIFEKIPLDMEPMPYIVIIVDEMADLMLVAGKDIESLVQRLAQMARAAGIHLIMATQRPSVDVITGVIKANFPSRVSFKVTSKIDSRTIFGEQGAEQLLGMGDMLYMGNSSKISRAHGPFISDSEVENVAQFLKSQGDPEYITAVTEETEEPDWGVDDSSMSDDDKLYNAALKIVRMERKSSTSYIQRSLRIGYNRAAIIIERMEREGILSSPNHTGKREILIPEN